MIRFSKADPEMGRLRQCMQEMIINCNIPELHNGLYVFGASKERKAFVYLSPIMNNVIPIANYLLSKDVEVLIEEIGNPPEKNWIALNYNFRKMNPYGAARTCLFTYRGLNNFILW